MCVLKIRTHITIEYLVNERLEKGTKEYQVAVLLKVDNFKKGPLNNRT